MQVSARILQRRLLSNVTPDHSGQGTLYDGDPADPASGQVGEITLQSNEQDLIQFYAPDGTLGPPIPFRFLSA